MTEAGKGRRASFWAAGGDTGGDTIAEMEKKAAQDYDQEWQAMENTAYEMVVVQITDGNYGTIDCSNIMTHTGLSAMEIAEAANKKLQYFKIVATARGTLSVRRNEKIIN